MIVLEFRIDKIRNSYHNNLLPIIHFHSWIHCSNASFSNKYPGVRNQRISRQERVEKGVWLSTGLQCIHCDPSEVVFTYAHLSQNLYATKPEREAAGPTFLPRASLSQELAIKMLKTASVMQTYLTFSSFAICLGIYVSQKTPEHYIVLIFQTICLVVYHLTLRLLAKYPRPLLAKITDWYARLPCQEKRQVIGILADS